MRRITLFFFLQLFFCHFLFGQYYIFADKVDVRHTLIKDGFKAVFGGLREGMNTDEAVTVGQLSYYVKKTDLLPYLKIADTTGKWISNIKRTGDSVFFYKAGAWRFAFKDSLGSGGGGSPGGIDRSIQFNNATAFDGAKIGYYEVATQPYLVADTLKNLTIRSFNSVNLLSFTPAYTYLQSDTGNTFLYMQQGVQLYSNDRIKLQSATGQYDLWGGSTPEAVLDATQLTATRTDTLPNKSGVFAMISDIDSHQWDSTSIVDLHSEAYYDGRYYPLSSNPANYLTTVGILDSTSIPDLHSKEYYNTKYFQISNNLSEGVPGTMRTNMGLGTLATQSGTFSGTSSGTNTGDQTISLSSEASGSGSASIAVTLSNAAVIGKVLTGYTSGAGTVVATDNILQAVQKLNGNIGALTTGVSSVNSLTGAVALTGTTNKISISAANVFNIGSDVVTLTGIQALTNKDMSGAGNTWPTFNQNTTGSAAKWTTARNLAGNSVDGSANATFANKFIVQGTTDAGLSAAQFLGSLSTGIVKNTTTTGVLSIGVNTDLPVGDATHSGAMPTPPNDATKFLRGDATWAVPAGATSFYTTDGALTSNRTVDLSTYDLIFSESASNIGNFYYGTAGSGAPVNQAGSVLDFKNNIYAFGDPYGLVNSTGILINDNFGVGTITLSGTTIGTFTGNVTGTADKATNLVGGNNTTLLGSIGYQSNTDVTTMLAPNITTTKKFLNQTGDATNGAPPAWGVLAAGDIPDISATYQPKDADLTTIAGLTATTDNFLVSVSSAWASRTPAQVKTTLSLNSVENTALSTWAGTSSITTLGTIGTGIWNGTAIANANLANSTITIGSTSTALGATNATIAGLTLTTPVINGTITGTGQATAATASTITMRDASGNTRINNLIEGWTTTATTAGTTTMVVGDTYQQYWTGTTTQTIKLPTTSVVAGQQWQITNNSTGLVTVQSSGANTILILGASTSAVFTAVIATPTTAANWNFFYAGENAASGKVVTQSNSITYVGTDATTMTFPTTSATIARTDAAQTFTGVQTFVAPILGTPTSINLTNATSPPTWNQNTTGSAASLSVTGQTGLITFAGTTSTSRVKTVRDAADTFLELGGSYTPTGTWTSLTMVTPVLGTPTSGALTNCTNYPASGLAGTSLATGVVTASLTKSGNERVNRTVNSGTASVTVAAADIVAGVIYELTGTTARTFTFDTGTNISTSAGGSTTGDTFTVYIKCSGTSTGTITLAGGSGSTLQSSAVIAIGTMRTCLVRCTGTNTWVIY